MKRALAAAMTALFLAAVSTTPAAAQLGMKKLTGQQQKMKGCAAKWGDHKKATGEKGREAYRKYMGGCLKGSST